ncbi:ComEC/Rec2 family competence protein [Clostridium thermobutyricum]|uniref:ComEC/Rec2 family competence protein n=1 Tax=Clostridium thermobutyricum TaxID=29372 RepID=UPI003F521774
MKLQNLEKTRYPIVYICLSFFVSSIFYSYYDFNLGLVTILTSLFFIFVTFRESGEFLIIIIIVFLLGICINNSFYNIKFNNSESIRIIKSYNNFAVGEFKGREINLTGKISGVKEGEKVFLKGEFKKDINKEKGRIGYIEVKSYSIDEKSIFTKLSHLREGVKEELKRNLGERNATIVSSIIFGKDENLDKEDEEDIKELGIIHVMSVSGIHIAMIFLLIKKIINIKAGLILSFIYVLITGIGFSSLRAWIMIMFSSLAILNRKTKSSLGAIAISGILIFFWKPYCIFNIGFQLSFGATLGIILFNEKINDKLYKLNKILRDCISIALSAQIFIFPILIINFNTFSTAFILGNLLLVPWINLILIFGILGFVFLKVKFIFDFISYILIIFLDILDSFVRGLGYLNLKEVYLGELVGYFYIFIILSFYLYKRKVEFAKYIPIPYAIFLIISSYNLSPNIEYRKEGALLISYKGEKVIMASNKNIDIEEIQNKTGGKLYKHDTLKINSLGTIKRDGKNFLLKTGDKEYFLKMSSEKIEKDYDIINFKDGKEKELSILKEGIIVTE